MSIAQTILRQLGGSHRLVAMTGANWFVDNGNGVTFRIKGSRKANFVEIRLNSWDLYDIKTGIVGRKLRNVKQSENIHVEYLIRTVEKMTGLYLTI